MIFPGHVAASVLCRRHLRAPLWFILPAGLLPDVVDKFLYYGLHVGPSSRLPLHTLWAWLVLSLIVWGLPRLLQASNARDWALGWFVGYGAHLLCDSPLAGGDLPFLWPLRAYTYGSPGAPLSYLFGDGTWPVWTLIAEALLVTYTLATSATVRRWLRAWRRALAHGAQPL